MAQDQHRALSLRILWGLLVGVVAGVALNASGSAGAVDFINKNILDPIGQIFLRSLFMVVVPLVFASLAVGVANLGNVKDIKRLGSRLAVFYFCTTLIAILIGQALVMWIKPGSGIDPSLMEASREAFAAQVSNLVEKSGSVSDSLWPGLIYMLIPKNITSAFANGEMLAIISVAIIFGIALTLIEAEASKTTVRVLEAISEASVKVVGWIMKLAPFAVAALIASAVAKMGLSLITSVLIYVAVVFSGYLVQFFGVYSIILRFLIGMSPRHFYRKALPAIATAMSTSSSNATIPTSIQTLEQNFGVPRSIARFSIPLGATVNMDGTALFEIVAALFIAQIFGVEISLVGHVTLVILVLLTSVGVAGIPGGSIPLLMSAMAVVGIPPEGIAIILGVDRLLDMGRTTVNVTGDLVAGIYLSEKVSGKE